MKNCVIKFITLLLILIYGLVLILFCRVLIPINYEAAANSSKKMVCLVFLIHLLVALFPRLPFLRLGIMPYISASIFMQLMTILVPQMQKLQKEGESGQKKINQWTRYLTVGVTAFQASCLYSIFENASNQAALLPGFQPYFWVSTSNCSYSRNFVCNVAW